MQLLARLYVFTILWLGSLAAPLSADESTKRNFVENGQRPQLDSLTASAKIGTLDELTQSKTETPFLTVSADALSNPEIISIQIASATLSAKQATALSSDSPASVTRTTQDHSQTLVEPLRTLSVSNPFPVLALPTALTGTGGRTDTTQQVEPFRTSSSSDAFPALSLSTFKQLTGTAGRTETTQQVKSFRTSSSSDASPVLALSPRSSSLRRQPEERKRPNRSSRSEPRATPTHSLCSPSPTGTGESTETTQQVELSSTSSSSDASPVLALPTGTGESTETTQQVEPSSTSSSSDTFTGLTLSTTVQHLKSSGTGESTETTLQVAPFRTSSSSDAFPILALPTVEPLTGTGESTGTTQQVEQSSTSSSSDTFTSLTLSTTVQELTSSGTGKSAETTLQTNPLRTASISDTDSFSVVAFPTTEQLSAEPVPTDVPSSGPPAESPLPLRTDDRGGWGWPWGGCVVC
ncbi:hypothetical protein MVEN_01651000 [Mycena venus]|uniref:Uncharacterized protein n=1 Tax=Mycena venus TaxID=2733690 RepID=A0A8H6XP37_9AGAR|nr:hypothetical protein MVEN_01651000 [Mycena venus]